MPKTKPISVSDDLENTRVGYQVAIALANSVNETIWSMFNAMIVANSIVIAGVTFALTSQQLFQVFRIMLPIAGIALCLMWLHQVMRARAYVSYYFLSARELETHLRGNVKTILQGADFALGKTITFQIGDKAVQYRMSLFPRFMRGEIASYAIIFMFIIVYISTFF